MRWRSAVWVILAACGRLRFDPLATTDAPGGDSSAPGDAPALPAQVCELHQYPLGPGLAPANADVAATSANGVITVMWADAGDPTGNTFPWGARIDASSFVATVPPQQFGSLTPTFEIASVRDFGTALAYEPVTTFGGPEIDELDETMATQFITVLGTGALPGRDSIPLVVNTGQYALMTGGSAAVDFAPISATAMVGAASDFTPGGSDTISQLASDNGPDHVHVGFRVDGGAMPTCTMGSVYFTSPTMLQMTTMTQTPSSCAEIRVAASADSSDHLFGFWQQLSGELDVHFIDSSGTYHGPYVVSASGQAPRTRYDGTVYRLAWLDSSSLGSSEVLTIGSYTPLATATAPPVALPGYLPAGANGFTLLRDGSRVWLILVTPTALDVMTLCN